MSSTAAAAVEAASDFAGRFFLGDLARPCWPHAGAASKTAQAKTAQRHRIAVARRMPPSPRDAVAAAPETPTWGAELPLTPQNRSGVRIFAQHLGIASGQDLHHPVVEVIHRVAQDRKEASFVFFVGLLNVITQP